jgi:uncharacterized membrane protein
MNALWSYIHIYGNLIAFALGCAVFARKPGDALHVQLGYFFVLFMALAQAYSFMLKDGSENKNGSSGNSRQNNGSGSSWNALHLLSVAVLYWLYNGVHVVQERHKHKNWLSLHVTYMGSAFISIIIAGFGVAGRKLEVCISSGVHWTVFMVIGAAMTIPAFSVYKRSLKLEKNKY